MVVLCVCRTKHMQSRSSTTRVGDTLYIPRYVVKFYVGDWLMVGSVTCIRV